MARLLAIASVAAAPMHARALSDDWSSLTQSSTFMRILSLIAPYVSTEQLERFLHQFNSHGGRRALESKILPEGWNAGAKAAASHRALQQSSSPAISLPEGLSGDDVAPQAHNGWIDQQQWRNFTSSVSSSQGGVVLNYVTVRGSGTRGGVVMSVGHTEPVDKYAEQLYNLVSEGFSPVYAVDHRGQGRSSRLLDDHFKSHVEASSHFISDFRAFVDLADAEMTARNEGHGKRFLHCHSMGCAVAFTYLIDEYHAQRPNKFHAVAANAPLIKPLTDPFPYAIAVAIGKAMLLLGLDEAYPPTKGESFDELYVDKDNSHRPDRQRIQTARCIARRGTAYAPGHTGLCLGDVTARFASEFFGMFDAFDSFTKGSLSVPILVQQAKSVDGEDNDGTVINSEQNKFCGRQDTCSLTRYPESEHNIWFETDAIRAPALKEAYDFYDAHAGSLTAQNGLPPMCSWWQWWCAGEHCSCVWSCSHPAASC